MNLFKIPNLTKNRVFGLDLLCFFAIYGHAAYFLPFRDKVDLHMKIYYDGVGIFFVLSGFLVGTIIIKQLFKDDVKKSELIHFWKQRLSRTLPSYYLFLLFVIIISYLPIWDNVDIFISTLLNRKSSWGITMSILYLLFLVVTISLSVLIYKYFEIPTTKYLRNNTNLISK
ncbi:hypothetical protein [Chishuiella sp.]|uniref:hypothetical protein n=1 Tax=Chishuiella sp. TaxID=1969467 RepID=UPI0028AB1BDB|nr:hypothetical protein [Chishuiella sp.]